MLLARNTSRNLPQNLAPLMDEVHSAGSVSVVDEAFTPTEHDSQNIGAVDIVVSDNPSPLDVDYFFYAENRFLFKHLAALLQQQWRPPYGAHGCVVPKGTSARCRR